MKKKSFKKPSYQPQSARSPKGSTTPSRSKSIASQTSLSIGSEHPRSWRLVGGTHAIREAMKIHGRQCKTLILRDDYVGSDDLREMKDLGEKLRLKIELRNRVSIDKTFSSNQGALLFVDGDPKLKANALEKEKSIVLILDGLEDPHNLGAIIRTAWLVGVDLIYIPQDRSVGLTPTVHKIASGGVEHVPVIATSDFEGVVRELKAKDFWVFGLEGTSQNSLYNLKIPQKVCWVVGSEDRGMRKGTQKTCDELVRLPQVSLEASYNASVAVGMALAETQRQILLASPK